MIRISTILSLFLFSCNANNETLTRKDDGFKLPSFIHQQKFDSIEPWRADGINEVFPEFIGQYKFSDTVNFDERQLTKIDQAQYRWEQNVYAFDTISSDGLKVYPDYDNTIISKLYDGATKGSPYFPIYIANETKEPKVFIGKDHYVFAIQEAADACSGNSWYAIEAKGFDFCSNGYFRRKILPGEFVVFLMPKYSGPDTTYFRTRIKNGASLVISKPYKGFFDKRQFATKDGNNFMNDIKNPEYKWVFYSAQKKV